MCASSVEHKNISVIAVNQQPVRRNMTFPIVFMIACQLMIPVSIRQRGRDPERINHCQKLLQIIPALCTGLEILFEPGRISNIQHFLFLRQLSKQIFS